MAMRFPHLMGIALWVSLLFLLLVHGLTHLWSRNNTLPSHSSLINPSRKVLMAKFNFTAFNTSHRQYTPVAKPDGDEIDPRYGVEKRLVPTGPNPLHH
ncbi:CLAVATA3/ESR CLE-related protein 12-like protein [Cinnamomum micranthum f. kanehirae]|uniref:CLAVATA3/ESR CLE-related protein 12-like protein n=1 Tax=Cinnamomum micranthum f. kanehirae TaxID=337451 RepID=A0A443NUA2_9MAGN|nr:CLAVATA3/ESR CLE-related protein 12-like protein [Cinnamomum micranthum f. kanehirae]